MTGDELKRRCAFYGLDPKDCFYYNSIRSNGFLPAGITPEDVELEISRMLSERSERKMNEQYAALGIAADDECD
jgi:hypothetical protein